jgi:hypothetical protein
MRINIRILMIILFPFIFFLLLNDVIAQNSDKQIGTRGRGQRSKCSRMYDTSTVETITGVIVKVERITVTKGRSCGLHLMVSTDEETLSVHLGPEWYFDKLDLEIESGDDVEVTGSRIEYEGEPAIIAAKVEKGDQTLILRDEIGIPVWSGWRRGR